MIDIIERLKSQSDDVSAEAAAVIVHLRLLLKMVRDFETVLGDPTPSSIFLMEKIDDALNQ